MKKIVSRNKGCWHLLRYGISDTMKVYLDHNATTPVHPEILDKVATWAKDWGNPSSIHQSARGPKSLIRDARTRFSEMIGASPLEIVFTSGGSESNNYAIKGTYFYLKTQNSDRNHYLVSAVEHPSVLEAFDFLKRQGCEVELIPVSKSGEIDLNRLEKQIRTDTALVSCMLANNETGHLFPVRKMAKLAHDKGARFHTDAVQALGKLNLNLPELGVDLASFSGHKFYSLKGAGVLFVKKGVKLESLIHGGGQERNRRAGTENVLALAALGYMCAKRDQIGPQFDRLTDLRDSLERRALEISGVSAPYQGQKRLPNTSHLQIENCDGETLLMNLDIEGVCVSTGAACSSGSNEPSPVLRAMGWTRKEAQNSLRISLGWLTTQEEVDFFIEKLNKVVKRIRSLELNS